MTLTPFGDDRLGAMTCAVRALFAIDLFSGEPFPASAEPHWPPCQQSFSSFLACVHAGCSLKIVLTTDSHRISMVRGGTDLDVFG